MKYFLLRTDPQFHNIPKIRDWFEKVDRRNIRMGKSYKIENRQLFFVENDPQIVFPDVLSFPFFMVTEVLRDVILAYEPKTIFKEIVLLEQENAKTCTYFMPILDYINCLAPASTLTRDRSTIIDAVLDLERLNGQSIFYIESVGNLYTVARLDIVESFLRRGALALGLTEVKTVYETTKC